MRMAWVEEPGDFEAEAGREREQSPIDQTVLFPLHYCPRKALSNVVVDFQIDWDTDCHTGRKSPGARGAEAQRAFWDQVVATREMRALSPRSTLSAH